MNKALLTLLIWGILLTGCSKQPPVASQVYESVRGQWTSERAYSNPYFGVTLTIPPEWELHKGDEQNMKFMLDSAAVASGQNRQVENALRQQFGKIHVPMRVLKYANQDRPAKNPNLLVMIENTGGRPSIKTGADFLVAMAKTMGAGFHFDGEPTPVTLNGIDLWTSSSTLDVNGGAGVLFAGAGGFTVHQQGYSTVKGQYALTILRTWYSSSDDPTADLLSENIAALASQRP